MKAIAKKNLKNKTSKVIQAEITKAASPRSFKEAWGDIENLLRKTRPHFKSAKEAMAWTRKRATSL